MRSLLATLLLAMSFGAQAFAERPLRFIVPFPGGFADTLARMVGGQLSDALGQPVVVENKPGGSGQIGAAETLRAPADAHTLFLGHIGTHAINPHMFAKLSYDPDRDFAPVTLLVTVPNLLVVHTSVQASNVLELVALAKANPGKLAYASPGNGTSGHLAAELFKSLAGVDLLHVPYKGAAPALQDVMGGQVQLIFDTLAQSYPQSKVGKVRALAVTTAKRHPAAPEVPTMQESGFPGWETGPWFGVFVRAGAPQPAIARLQAEIAKALALPEIGARLAAQGADPAGNSPEAFAAFIRAESARWGKVVRDAGIRAD